MAASHAKKPLAATGLRAVAGVASSATTSTRIVAIACRDIAARSEIGKVSVMV
eukprot:CAMPEP_0117536218 /NCGR_PEP_ID=MMETSP0784-20121206/41339_1 /TAXON_ID=39447 /ORGANISM="" /LENGTH=52 /DNA_ID=CAMNT_0005332773 /DNA_START=9 /DNA_END=168 /DNA_ORIENTATION=-